MQALGSDDGGHMLFLGLGTGLGSAMIVAKATQPARFLRRTVARLWDTF